MVDMKTRYMVDYMAAFLYSFVSHQICILWYLFGVHGNMDTFEDKIIRHYSCFYDEFVLPFSQVLHRACLTSHVLQ